MLRVHKVIGGPVTKGAYFTVNLGVTLAERKAGFFHHICHTYQIGLDYYLIKSKKI